LKSAAEAKHVAHAQYEIIRAALPDICKGTDVEADDLETFISDRLHSSALDAAATALERTGPVWKLSFEVHSIATSS